jgi:hypothetical protein
VQERVEKFKQEGFARIEKATGLTFDRDTGKCITPTEVKMEGGVQERWAELVQQFDVEKDPDKFRQLLQEVGRLIRGETSSPEVKPTSAHRTDR